MYIVHVTSTHVVNSLLKILYYNFTYYITNKPYMVYYYSEIRYTVYIVHSTVYSVHSTVYVVHCTYNVQCTVYNVQ